MEMWRLCWNSSKLGGSDPSWVFVFSCRRQEICDNGDPSAAHSVDGLPIPPSAKETTYHIHGQVVMSGYAVDHTASKLSNGVQARASFSDNTQSFTVHGGEGASSCIGLIGGRSHYPPHCYLNCY